MCRVVNVRVKFIRSDYENLHEWMEDENNVYIGRRGVVFLYGKRYPAKDSVWCNPFKIGKDGDRNEVVKKYREYIEEKIRNDEVELNSLRNKTLGCWCKPNECHGDILIELLETQNL